MTTPVLFGETYLHGFTLLVPRFIWPEKPTAHQSQRELNVHFRRNLYEYSHERKTFIAWGILAEAYGNFGPYFGAIFSGVFLGMLFKFLSFFAINFPVNSVRSVIALTLLAMSIAWPTMESSVIVTSTLQVVVLIILLGFVLGKKTQGASLAHDNSTVGITFKPNSSTSSRIPLS